MQLVMDGTATTFHPAGSILPDVLLVEDERISRRALASLLTSSGYTSEACESAEEALRYVDGGQPPPVALVDVDLPGMSGLDLIERLEKMRPGMLSVLITAAEGDRIDRFRRDHVVSYLRKPVNFQSLLDLLQDSQAGHSIPSH